MKNINWGADFNLLYARYYSKYLVDGKNTIRHLMSLSTAT